MKAQGELVRPLDVSALAREGSRRLEIEASAEECAAIAARLGIPAIGLLKAALCVEPEGQDGARLHGRLSAEITQTCVVTLEPFAVRIDEPFDLRYAAATPMPGEMVDPEAPDPPEPLPADNVIEAGELIVQHLALALDPYPRKAGALFNQEGTPQAPALSPFAKLAALKQEQNKG